MTRPSRCRARALSIGTRTGGSTTKPRRRDVNDDGKFGTLKGTPNEWSVLVFNGGTIGKRQDIGALLNVARSRYKQMPEP